MYEDGEVSRLLDILGNRNRRRIVALLRQKPCFVTEISERLVVSPKAVIEHLRMMEREKILVSRQDERRRKYYYLSHDINVIVNLQKRDAAMLPVADADQREKFIRTLTLLRRLVRARDDILNDLEHLERDIESKVNEIMRTGTDLLDERELDLLFSLSHHDLTLEELEELSGLSTDEINGILDSLIEKGFVERTDRQYCIRGTYGE